ncbi:hypothetical protein INT46_003891 [Mucor plumbeus]|uniref:Diphthamide biosynthesis protein 3 n=1 Tax=Mucor plumbeus TaxID=97098 RepID=A0A8H7QDF4_9FUNG|nr:hypothetical protein INT46_003891 [Mucor plumbeus]
MASFYDEVEIEDMDYDQVEEVYSYPCPCGDKFIITTVELSEGLDVAQCPSCSLVIKVIYDPDDFIDEDDQTVFEVAPINLFL